MVAFAHIVALCAATVAVTVDSDVVSLSEHVVYLEDQAGTLTLDDVLSRHHANSFVSPNMDVPSFGFQDSVYWFRVDLEGQHATDEWVLELGYPHLDWVDVYVAQLNGEVSTFQMGDRRVFSERHRPHRTLTAPIHLTRGQRVQVLIRIETESSVQVPMTLYTERAFGDHAARENFAMGIHYGLILIMMVFNLVLFFSLPDRSYLLYVAYLGTFLVATMSLNGTFAQWVLSDVPSVSNALLLSSLFVCGALIFEFMVSFLELEQRWPELCPALRGYEILCVLGALGVVVLPYGVMARVAVAIVVGGCVVELAVGIISWKRGFEAARYFVLAWAFFLAGSIVTALAVAGILPSNFLTVYAYQIGSALEVTLLSLALGQRFEVIRQEASAVHRKQVEVERRLNVELETKMHIFSDVSHRLNNPLNFISGGIENLADLMADHRERLWALFPPEGQRDGDAQAMIDSFDGEFRKLADYLADVTAGAMRTSTFVREMRGLSGVDGSNFDPVSLIHIVDRGMERVRDNMGTQLAGRLTINEARPVLETTTVLGNVYLHAMVVSLAVEALLDHADEEAPLTLGIDVPSGGGNGRVQLKLAVSPGFYGDGAVTMRDALELLTSLLSPYGGQVTMVDDCPAGEGGVLLSLVSEMTLLPRYSKTQGLQPD